MKTEKIYQGNCIEVLKDMPDESIDCVVTSPPYWGLRNYQEEEQLGLEETPEEFVANLVKVFSEVKRVLKKEGTVWLNLGDSYYRTGADQPKQKGLLNSESVNERYGFENKNKVKSKNLKPKDLCGIPWRVAFALQADGWYLRQDIIWAKNNCMPESVKDRCTKSHEYIFLLTKSPKYFYDIDAIREPAKEVSIARSKREMNIRKITAEKIEYEKAEDPTRIVREDHMRNKRSVWHMNTAVLKEAHFATFPIELPTYCIKAGCPEKGCKKCKKPVIKELYRDVETMKVHRNVRKGNGDRAIGGAYTKFMQENPKKMIEKPTCSCNVGFEGGIVLDPFFGSGTTGLAAQEHNRHWVGIELNEEYIEIAHRRLAQKTLFV